MFTSGKCYHTNDKLTKFSNKTYWNLPRHKSCVKILTSRAHVKAHSASEKKRIRSQEREKLLFPHFFQVFFFYFVTTNYGICPTKNCSNAVEIFEEKIWISGVMTTFVLVQVNSEKQTSKSPMHIFLNNKKKKHQRIKIGKKTWKMIRLLLITVDKC